jgi:ABC-type transport system involved in multi-copper enzyme maturation permease subunit
VTTFADNTARISAWSQTGAILLDAYRELNARKMFWISLGISLLIVASIAALGINERGLTIFGYTLDGFSLGPIPINTSVISPTFFYKTVFVSIGVSLWLGWASTILALVSTASIIPDFVSSGAIENMLARPISRVRLFLTKYLASLLFVFLQAFIFTLASIVVIGLRSGEWLWALMLAVPLVTLFFSYLYCVSALVGVWTRSTLAALLAALAMWGIVLAINIAELGTLTWRTNVQLPMPIVQRDIDAAALQLKAEADAGKDPARLAMLQTLLERKRKDLIDRTANSERAAFWHNAMFAAKTILPKTDETKGLLLRAIATDQELEKLVDASDDDNRRGGPFGQADRRTRREVEKVTSSRSVWWVVLTSLAFEAVILGWATRIFARRDF